LAGIVKLPTNGRAEEDDSFKTGIHATKWPREPGSPQAGLRLWGGLAQWASPAGHAYALTGQKERAEALFRRVTAISTLSETYLNFASLLASEGRNPEAREWIQKVLDKRPTMPGYQRRRERPWFRSANAMLKRLPA
jgi:tetratricopeptide (TPR) repeat protein